MRAVLLSSYVYDNFELYNPTVSMDMIVWSLCLGLGIGAVVSFVNRRALGGLVRKLTADGIDTPEKAVTLAEAGYGRNPVVRLALRTGRPLRRMVLCANEEEFVRRRPSEKASARRMRKLFSIEAEEKVVTDFSRARFYIPEDLRCTAETRYDLRGTSVPSLLLSLLLLLGIALAALYLLPELLTMLDNFLSMIRE